MPCTPGPQCWGARDARTGVNATVYDANCVALYDTYIAGCGEAPAAVAPGVAVNPVATPGQPAPVAHPDVPPAYVPPAAPVAKTPTDPVKRATPGPVAGGFDLSAIGGMPVVLLGGAAAVLYLTMGRSRGRR